MTAEDRALLDEAHDRLVEVLNTLRFEDEHQGHFDSFCQMLGVVEARRCSPRPLGETMRVKAQMALVLAQKALADAGPSEVH